MNHKKELLLAAGGGEKERVSLGKTSDKIIHHSYKPFSYPPSFSTSTAFHNVSLYKYTSPR